MTYKEKLKELHPDWDEELFVAAFEGACPTEYMNVAGHSKCGIGVYDSICSACWDQEYIELDTEEKEIPPENNEISCNICIHEKVCKYKDKFIEAMELLKNVPDGFEIIIRCKHSL